MDQLRTGIHLLTCSPRAFAVIRKGKETVGFTGKDFRPGDIVFINEGTGCNAEQLTGRTICRVIVNVESDTSFSPDCYRLTLKKLTK